MAAILRFLIGNKVLLLVGASGILIAFIAGLFVGGDLMNKRHDVMRARIINKIVAEHQEKVAELHALAAANERERVVIKYVYEKHEEAVDAYASPDAECFDDAGLQLFNALADSPSADRPDADRAVP